MTQHRHPQSPRLDHCPETLPREAYIDPTWYARELDTVFAKNWISAGRLNDLAPGTLRRVQVGAASVLLARGKDGQLSAFHNACRHRGSELCRHEEQPLGKLITCPYHAWSYAADTGRLISTAHAQPTEDFHKADHGLVPVSVKLWNGFVFLNLAQTPPALKADVGLETLNNWPMGDLITGHRATYDLACNWKVFWENYSECLHCPGIHPELCDMVPIYGKGIMGASEALGWTPDQAKTGNLKQGAESWTMTGAPCGPVFPNLTAEERQNGYNFVTLWPTMYVVAHVDYVRSVRIEATGPETTRLIAEWHFPQETLDQPGFDAAEVAAFAKIVLAQDGDAAEMNQRGIRSPSYTRGRLMPEEYEIAHFHQWLLNQMEVAP
jgi:glycine betaine catabolism A